jgi:hypothetical protein
MIGCDIEVTACAVWLVKYCLLRTEKNNMMMVIITYDPLGSGNFFGEFLEKLNPVYGLAVQLFLMKPPFG